MRIKNMVLAIGMMAAGIPICSGQPVASPAPAQAPAKQAAVPKIQFEKPVYEFGKISAGEVVKHTFYFTNTGDQVLEVSNVQPSCGCTTAGEWSRRVEPGKFGTIPVQFNSGNFNGQVTKTVTVTCNDRSQPSTTLQIKGTIWRPIEVAPQFAVLNVIPETGTNASTTVKILNHLDEPLTLSAPESSQHAFTAELKTIKPGKEFDLIVTAVPPFVQGNVQGNISVKTSSTNMPLVTVVAWANVQPLISVSPQQMVLPRPPLPNKVTASVMIQNRGTNQLTLSDPKINVEGAEVEIKETAAGKAFSISVNFPEGLELPKGQQVELTIKSNHPQHPLIKVPVIQMPAPPAHAKAPAAAQPLPTPTITHPRPTVAPAPPPLPATPTSAAAAPRQPAAQ